MARFGRILVVVGVIFFMLVQVLPAAEGKHTIWKVTSDTSVIYLVGSIHLLNEQSYPLPDIYEKIYRESQNIAFETDIEQLSTPEFQKKVAIMGMYSPGQNLRSVLTAETYRQLERYLTHTDVDIEQMTQLKPWLCSATITVMELEKLGFNQKNGLDAYFYTKAVQDGKVRLIMESVDEHLAVLSDFDSFDPDIVIMQTLIDLENLSNYFSEMLVAWKKGESQQLDQLINRGIRHYPEMKEKILYKRNRNWLSKIEKLLKMKQTGMIVIGAAHLAGENSVVDLLQRKGFHISQL